MKFRVRVDSPRDDEKFLKFLNAYAGYVIVHHVLPHGNPHYHIYIDASNTIISIDAIRKRIDRYFSVKGPDRSVKECDPERINEYVQYLFNEKHGNVPTLIGNSGFNDTLLLQLQTQAKDVADDFAQRKKVKLDKKQVSQYDLVEEVQAGIKALHIDDPTIEQYTKVAIQVMRKHRKAFCKFSLGRIIMSAMKDEEVVAQMQNYFRML